MLGKVHSLNPILFKDMMIESHEQIAKEKENINAINVFPIPDGDTGSNIYYTLRAIVDEVNLVEEGNGEKIFQAISKGSFVGAKGNSGVIYSQFLIGVVDYLDTAKEVTPATFTEALKDGTEFAYESVLNPTEGTILTVMKEVTDKAVELISQNPEINWIDFINILVETSWDCLERTKEMLDVLKEANVVDAGAKGFVHILESWRDIIVKE
ncbi:MAG: DAK2 domain-containing protein [Candidatus Heimdallarchaeota archaeon]|nr:DAK2 domain-containing protein [Candidatus Heimdallarchaeota archaeon]MCG3255795.1 DAK2 domain-containing protein [Candidatus Heimdallarchaeota archaeon]MCK4610868.1 DAK2 domain-containing protein [Candidatus Heimdallarchaeota archaeon]